MIGCPKDGLGASQEGLGHRKAPLYNCGKRSPPVEAFTLSQTLNTLFMNLMG